MLKFNQTRELTQSRNVYQFRTVTLASNVNHFKIVIQNVTVYQTILATQRLRVSFNRQMPKKGELSCDCDLNQGTT